MPCFWWPGATAIGARPTSGGLLESLDGHRGEQDVADDCCADLRDERDDRQLRAMQGFHDVGLLASAEGAFVHETHRVPIACLF